QYAGRGPQQSECGRNPGRRRGPGDPVRAEILFLMRSKSYLGAVALCFPLLLAGEAIPDPNRGIYAIWSRPEISDALDFVKGDQARLQWSEVQTAPDRYDFSSLHTQLERIAKLGRATTVQLNANRHPAFLTGIVPKFKGAVRRGETDGLWQYWHPAYVQAY